MSINEYVDPNYTVFKSKGKAHLKQFSLSVIVYQTHSLLFNNHIIMGKNVGFANFTNRSVSQSVSQSVRIQTVWLCSIHMDNFVMKPFFLMPYKDKIIVHNIGIKTNIWDKV